MSKFNKELLQKLDALKVEREKLQKQMENGQKRLVSLNNAIYGVEQLLHLEGVEIPAPEAQKPITTVRVRLLDRSEKTDKPLADFLKKILADRKPHATEDLIASVEAMGYSFGDKNPRRAVNFTLMGLQRRGDFERHDNEWRYTG